MGSRIAEDREEIPPASRPLAFLGRHARAVQETNTPRRLFSFENSRLQPGHVVFAGLARDRTAIDVGDPGDLPGDVDFGFRHRPDVNVACRMGFFDELDQTPERKPIYLARPIML